MIRNIANKAVLMAGLSPEDLPETCGLLEVFGADFSGVAGDFTGPFLMFRERCELAPRGFEARGLQRGSDVVRISSVVGRKVHEPVTLEGRVDRCLSVVRSELLIIHPETVSSCVRVREHSRL